MHYLFLVGLRWSSAPRFEFLGLRRLPNCQLGPSPQLGLGGVFSASLAREAGYSVVLSSALRLGHQMGVWPGSLWLA